MDELDRINKTLHVLDPQGTWWQRLILIFFHPPTDQRLDFVQTTLPDLVKHLPTLPCISLFPEDSDSQQRRILHQQACLHHIDMGWWHGSTAMNEEISDDDVDDDDDDDKVLLPMAVIVGTKIKKKKKPQQQQPLFSIDSGVELKHRFSRKWTEAPQRHHSNRSIPSHTF
ncbi:hypothetical protein BC941DRAFT_427227 [Chlamydoabsidia padenii]|nr:hypothetical protein BC941DRAFT_427227 [Chlamydoabsidia padenii]